MQQKLNFVEEGYISFSFTHINRFSLYDFSCYCNKKQCYSYRKGIYLLKIRVLLSHYLIRFQISCKASSVYKPFYDCDYIFDWIYPTCMWCCAVTIQIFSLHKKAAVLAHYTHYTFSSSLLSLFVILFGFHNIIVEWEAHTSNNGNNKKVTCTVYGKQ